MSKKTKIKKLAINSFVRPWQILKSAGDELIGRINSFDFSSMVMPSEPADPEDDCGYEIENGVAKIEICGVITDCETMWDEMFGLVPADSVIEAIREADADPEVVSLELYIDSPGGYASSGGMIAQAVANCKKDIVATCGGLVASAAYRVASQCDSISAPRDSMIGAIGTYAVLCDTTAMQEKIGIRLTLVTSGGVKGAGADGKVTPELSADVDREVKELNDLFVTDVAKGRGLKQTRARELADGRVHIASSAKQLGLIDSIESFTKENKAMTNEQFAAFAQQNPEDVTVKSIHAQGHKLGKADGVTEGQAQERQRVLALFNAFAGDTDFIKSQIETGATIESASVAYVPMQAAKMAAKITELETRLAAKPTVIDAGGSPAIPLAAAATPTAASVKPTDDPKAQAEWEWVNEKPQGFTDSPTMSAKDRYVAIRTAELAGSFKMIAAPAK